ARVVQRVAVGGGGGQGADEPQRFDRLAGRVDEGADPLAPGYEAAREEGVEGPSSGDPADAVRLAQPLFSRQGRSGGELVGADAGAEVLLELGEEVREAG